jgi:hypothetical protein
MKGTELAPEGKLWVCMACGKVSRTRYGFLEGDAQRMPDGTRVASRGWDESCMMNAELVDYEESLQWLAEVKP